MSSAHNLGANHWGTLINPDKSPSLLLEGLCLGIAHLMTTFDSCGTTDLTPERLATFYKKVGGNYDTLFLETKGSALSFIYQSLGCFHSLQPTTNAFEPPSIPALLPHGFVRWQTIQLLLDPDEHCEYLQNAVEQWDIPSPGGGFFPKTIPRTSFPSEPDPEMVEWHEEVSRRLEYDYWKKNTPHPSPPTPSAHHFYTSAQDPRPEEDDYFAHSHHPRASSHRRSDPEPRNDYPSRSQRRRRGSAEHPSSSTHRVDPDFVFVPPVEEIHTGFAEPRAPTPPPFPARPSRSRGREQSPIFVHAHGARTKHTSHSSDASCEDSEPPAPELPIFEERYKRHRNLSPPRNSHARRHSHDAAYRIPQRDASPNTNRRYPRGDIYASNPSRWREPDAPPRRAPAAKVYSDEVPAHPKCVRPSGVRFKEYIFDDPPVVVAPESPGLAHPYSRYVTGLSDNYVTRSRSNIDPVMVDDVRRGSYSGSGSRNGSGPERTRSYSNVGMSSRAQRWDSPSRSAAAKRYTPVGPTEDYEYTRMGQRAAMYDR